jgi:SAM-dependent methyltransferase
MTSFNLVAYERMRLANPVSEAAIGGALDRTDLGPGDRAAELGCGNAALALLLAERGLRVLAVDRGAEMADLARRRVEATMTAGQVEVRLGEAEDIADGVAPFRLVAALGTTALGDFSRLASWIAPGGWLLWGDLYFRQTPVIAAGGAGLDYDTDEGWRGRAAAAGLELDHVRISEDADWDAHLDELTAAVSAWIEDDPDHPARRQIEARLAAVQALYSPANRESLGFILYLFRKPS